MINEVFELLHYLYRSNEKYVDLWHVFHMNITFMVKLPLSSFSFIQYTTNEWVKYILRPFTIRLWRPLTLIIRILSFTYLLYLLNNTFPLIFAYELKSEESQNFLEWKSYYIFIRLQISSVIVSFAFTTRLSLNENIFRRKYPRRFANNCMRRLLRDEMRWEMRCKMRL